MSRKWMEWLSHGSDFTSSLTVSVWSALLAALLIRLCMYWRLSLKFHRLSKIPGIGDWPFLGSVPFLSRNAAGSSIIYS